MFDIGSSELLLIVIVAVVVIGPKDLPRVLYKLGQIIGKGRAMTRHFRSGIDEMIRQAELEEMEKKWAAENARIMAQTPAGQTQVDQTPAALPSVAQDNSYEVMNPSPPALEAPARDEPHAAGPQVPAQDEGFKPFVAAPTPETLVPAPKKEDGSAA